MAILDTADRRRGDPGANRQLALSDTRPVAGLEQSLSEDGIARIPFCHNGYVNAYSGGGGDAAGGGDGRAGLSGCLRDRSRGGLRLLVPR